MTGGGEMGLGTRVTLRDGLVWAMGLFLAVAVVGGLAVHGPAQTLVVNGLGMLAVWMSAGVCWLAVARVGSQRWEVLLSAAAVTSFGVSITGLGIVVAGGGPVPLVSLADVGILLFYPLMLAALRLDRHPEPGRKAPAPTCERCISRPPVVACV